MNEKMNVCPVCWFASIGINEQTLFCVFKLANSNDTPRLLTDFEMFVY